MKLYIIIALIPLFASCAQQRQVSSSSHRDSTSVTTMTRTIPQPDTLSTSALFYCDSVGRVRIKEIAMLSTENFRLNTIIDSLGHLAQQIIYIPDTIYVPQHHTSVRTTTSTATATPSPRFPFSSLLFAITCVATAVTTCILLFHFKK